MIQVRMPEALGELFAVVMAQNAIEESCVSAGRGSVEFEVDTTLDRVHELMMEAVRDWIILAPPPDRDAAA